MTKEKHKIIPASYLVLIKDNKVLLLRRFNTTYEDGKYSLPAGHVEEEESFTQCIIRESEEEIGVTVQSENLKVAHVMQRIGKSEAEHRERIDVFFTAEKYNGKIENKEPDKCDDLSWLDINNLPENTIPYIKSAIEAIKNKTFYSEFGW